MELNIWEIGHVISKWLIYIGFATAIGGPFIGLMIRQHQALASNVARYCIMGCICALFALAINFFMQVGAFAENGFIGIFDKTFITILWQSAVGDSVIFRILGLSLIACALIAMPSYPVILMFFYGIGVLLLAYSFSTIGHSVDLGTLARFILGFHVLAMAGWMGALYPLWQACDRLPVKELRILMHRFGQIAGGFVAVLLICGVVLTWKLLASPMELITTSYGITLTLKIAGVTGILLLAAWHKWRLTPQLATLNGVSKLKKSISIEIALATVILGFSATLSTLLSPASFSM